MTRCLDPDTPPIGRQPSSVRIAPSKALSYIWLGSIVGGREVNGAIVDGDRFTVEQQRALMELGRDVPTAEALLVKRQATAQERWWPRGSLPPVFAFQCPVIGCRGDRVKVIVPNGTAKLVQEDGWGHRPFRIPRDEWGNPLQ